MNKLSRRTKDFLLNMFASCGILYSFLRPDSFLTRGESFLTALICLCFLELSADIRKVNRRMDK